jgi:hypothetical protein
METQGEEKCLPEADRALRQYHAGMDSDLEFNFEKPGNFLIRVYVPRSFKFALS